MPQTDILGTIGGERGCQQVSENQCFRELIIQVVKLVPGEKYSERLWARPTTLSPPTLPRRVPYHRWSQLLQ